MWFGTYGGLNRYDGYKMISYRSEHGKVNSLQSNSLTTLFEDHDGNIWIGTYGGGLFKYDPAMEKFTQYKYLHLRPESNIIPKVSSIFEDSSNVLWIGTSEGLDRFDRKEEKFYNYKFKSDIHADNNITVVYKGSSSNLWIGTYFGLKLFNRETGNFTCFNHDSSKIGRAHV
jgi:ligand-binding sensor domain-containing protein